ncbi:acylneuraminate cytidylyltransferase family protein [Phocaeicola dorei]|uniref:acylneuraminate cytidylyltransferase family protein n=1 Tax=Phocaeicola dorei TaxID=357276 RepID=UPI00234C8CFF|nr:cytidylyltransferase [Phocaeicola dorei]MDC7170574.1 cytidylyltransferase [Phocaeicola dorei]
MKITAVIPIRSGSQRVKDKNLRAFADTNLMELKIKNLLQVPELTSIVVNTNSELAIEIVNKSYRGVTTHRREEYYASSQCSGSEFFRHLGEVTDTDLFVYCPCTSPFIKPETVSQCINQFISTSDYDCLATVSSVKEFLWLDGDPMNYDPAHAPNSQDLPDVVALNFGVTVVRKEDLIKNSNIIGKNPQFVKTSDIESIDIDTPLDFYIAEQLYKKLVIEKKRLLE